MEMVKVYLDETRNACIVCGNCGKAREISFSEREAPRSSLVKCSCGNSFIVSFEKRQYYRKQVDIRGLCFESADPTEGTPVKITDISVCGLQFDTSGDNKFQLNQKLRVIFRLEGQIVNLVVCVRHIRGKKIGVEIISIEEHSKKIMGFYLLP